MAGSASGRRTGGREMTGDDWMEIGTLIVDDQHDIRLLVRMLIERADRGLFVAGEAASGEEALGRVEIDDPVVIVLDEMMPGMNGLEAASEIRSRRPQQVIILFSAYLDDEVIAEAQRIGVQLCVPKEDVQQLPDLIRQAAQQAAHG